MSRVSSSGHVNHLTASLEHYGKPGEAAAELVKKLGSNAKLVKDVNIVNNRSDPAFIQLKCGVNQTAQLRAALEKAGAEVSRNNLPTDPFIIRYKFGGESFHVQIREDRPVAVLAST